MEKGAILFFVLAVLVLWAGDYVTGFTITGMPTYQVNMNITVVAFFPTLSIISPHNETYLTNVSLLVNYSASGQQAVWYNLDNGANTTITSFSYFNTSEGGHMLHLYANSSWGNVSEKNVSFSVNLTRFIIIDNEYETGSGDNTVRKQKLGQSTDFFDYAYEDMQSLSGIILHIPNYGKIIFRQAVNLTNDENPDDNVLDLDTNTNISFNRIELNSSALPNFNVSATLEFYNLTFSNPRILKDGAVCPLTICSQNKYLGGTLDFNVTGFSIYSAEETPSGEVQQPPFLGGGGGRAGISVAGKFSLDKEKIKVSLKQGETKEEEITLTNIGTDKIKINLETDLGNFLRISEDNFELKKGESKKVILDFIAGEDAVPNLYMGKILVKAGDTQKEILVAIEIESKKPLFGVGITIPEKFLKVAPGGILPVEVTLHNLGETGRVDVTLNFFIKDKEGNEILITQETMAVETTLSFIKEIKIPEDMEPGEYLLYVKGIYYNKVASASDWFTVEEVISLKLNLKKIALIALAILISLIALIVIIWALRRKVKKRKT